MLYELLRGHSILAKAIRFGLVGCLSSLFYGLCTWFMAGTLRLPAVPASAMGYLLAIPMNFYLQKHFSFRAKGHTRTQAPRFLFVHGLNLLVSIAVMHVSVSILGLDYRAGALATMVLIPLLSFIAMNAWVFAARSPDKH